MHYLTFFVLLVNYVFACISTFPNINQIVYVNSSQFIIVKPKQIQFMNRNIPNYHIKFDPKISNNGFFYQLSDTFSKYGYNNCNGKQITNSSTITDKNGRFVYKLVGYNNSLLTVGILDSVNIFIDMIDTNRQDIVLRGKIVFLPHSGTFVSSDFLLNDDGWTIINNHPIHTPIQEPNYCDWSSNQISLFITGTDNYINYDTKTHKDSSLWYFKAPSKYHIDLSLAYSGWIEYMQVFLNGDFYKLNDLNLFPIVRIECQDLKYAIEYYSNLQFTSSNSNHFTIQLNENQWIKAINKYNNIHQQSISKHDFTNCLANVSSFEILGDWTTGIETVGLDSVSIYIRQ